MPLSVGRLRLVLLVAGATAVIIIAIVGFLQYDGEPTSVPEYHPFAIHPQWDEGCTELTPDAFLRAEHLGQQGVARHIWLQEVAEVLRDRLEARQLIAECDEHVVRFVARPQALGIYLDGGEQAGYRCPDGGAIRPSPGAGEPYNCGEDVVLESLPAPWAIGDDWPPVDAIFSGGS